MTGNDGIIQQAFSDHRDKIQSLYDRNRNDANVIHLLSFHAQEIGKIEQALINEIRRWDKDNRGFYPYHISLKDLIGDNHE